MRLIIPDDIGRLADVIAPYMVMDESKKMFILREDAPQEVKAAHEEYTKWMQTHYRR